jgi:hypothetical protein
MYLYVETNIVPVPVSIVDSKLKENFRNGFDITFVMDRKNDCGTPTHQTRQQWTAKDVEKNRVSFEIVLITQNNKMSFSSVLMANST